LPAKHSAPAIRMIKKKNKRTTPITTSPFRGSSSSSSSSTMMMRNDGKVSADASSPTATTSITSLLSADAHLRLQMMELATIASGSRRSSRKRKKRIFSSLNLVFDLNL